MHSGPSKFLESIVSVLVPPACREEVVGDLHQRFKSTLQYAADALDTLPLVILSQIRRTADPQVLLIQAFAVYISFLGAAWLKDETVLRAPWGLLGLAVPAATVVLGLVLDDAYANPGRRSALNFARGPLLGVFAALGIQGVLWISNHDLAIPRWIAFYGSAGSLLLSSAVRMLFPPVTPRLRGANAAAFWLKQEGGSRGSPPAVIPVLKGISAVAAIAIVATWVTEKAEIVMLRPHHMVLVLLVVAYAYHASKRG